MAKCSCEIKVSVSEDIVSIAVRLPYDTTEREIGTLLSSISEILNRIEAVREKGDWEHENLNDAPKVGFVLKRQYLDPLTPKILEAVFRHIIIAGTNITAKSSTLH